MGNESSVDQIANKNEDLHKVMENEESFEQKQPKPHQNNDCKKIKYCPKTNYKQIMQ
jgi:hypothetical protein